MFGDGEPPGCIHDFVFFFVEVFGNICSKQWYNVHYISWNLTKKLDMYAMWFVKFKIFYKTTKC